MSSDQPELCRSSLIGIHHVGMSVSDLEASIEFYTEALGISLQAVTEKMQHDDGNLGFSAPSNSAVLVFPNGYLKLSEYDRSDLLPSAVLPVKGPGITHVCYQSPTSEDIYQRLMDGVPRPLVAGNNPFICWGRAYIMPTQEIMTASCTKPSTSITLHLRDRFGSHM